MRPFSNTPVNAWLWSRRSAGFFVIAFAMFSSRLLVPGGVLWPSIVATVLIVALGVAFLTVPPGRRFVRAVRGLHARLPWFEGDFVTWLPEARVPELRHALYSENVVMHDLDGRLLRDADDLANTAGALFGARTIPADSGRRAAAILADVGRGDRRVHAIVWHAAGELARHDPAAMQRVLLAWSKANHHRREPVLLCLVCDPAETAANGEVALSAQMEPAPAAPAGDAPHDVWWQRSSGRIAR